MTDSFTEHPKQGQVNFFLPVHQAPVTVEVNGVLVDIEYQDQDNVILSNPVNDSDIVEVFYTGKGSLDQPEDIPSGGTPGQVLKKTSGTNYDTEWGSISFNELTDVPDLDQDTFETVSKNLLSRMGTLTYTAGKLTSIEYAGNILKTLAYTGDQLTSVTLSGSGLPSGITLVKTFTYDGANKLIGFSYA